VGFLALSDGYGAYALVVDHGKEIRYGGVRGSVWGGTDLIVEVVEGGELKIAQRQGFWP
jgi:hypothetical protein